MTGSRRIYHLVPADVWDDECDRPEVAAEQLARHGFVHCCTREQIAEIASWWLKDDAPLVVLEIDVDRLPAGGLRLERPEGERREYPHVYGALPRSAVVAAHPLTQHDDGSFGLPATLAEPPPQFTVEGTFDGRPVEVTWRAGALVDAPDDVAARAGELLDKGAPVRQFLDVTGTASLATPYDAFSLLVHVLDDVSAYRGDGFAGGGLPS